MNKNNKTFLILVFAILFSAVSMLIIFFSDFTVNILKNVKDKLNENVFNKWIGILFTLNIFILILILFLKNMKNTGNIGLKCDIGEKGDKVNVYCEKY